VPKGPFTAEEFIATQWNAAENKAEFGNHLLRLIEARFPENLFTKTLYNRVSMCFQHIAHYVEGGIMQSAFAESGQPASGWPTLLRILSGADHEQRRSVLLLASKDE